VQNRFLSLIAGVLFSLIVLEIFLRLMGGVYFYFQQEDKTFKRKPGTFVVLCIGDSFTEGSGAPGGESYPSQLEDLFRKKIPEKKIEVVNKGMATFNTATILETFDENINMVEPDLMVILAGGANVWNAYGYGHHLNRKGWMEWLCNGFYNIKVFKLIKLFIYEAENKRKGFLKKGISVPDKIKLTPKTKEWWFNGCDAEREGRYEDAVFWYKKVFAKEPDFAIVHNSLARALFAMGNKELSLENYRKLIEKHPEFHEAYTAFALRFMQDPERDKESFQFMKQHVWANPVTRDILILKSISDKERYQQEIGSWITDDIKEMIRRAQKRGIKVILQSYPDYQIRYRHINTVLKEVAQKNRVVFIDNECIFNKLALKGKHKDNYFAFDKIHCNEKGYSVMAENIYSCILENKLIESGIKEGHR